MDISIVLPTYNRCELLDQDIQILLNQKTRGLHYEIIVVDNNSGDDTASKVNAYVARDQRATSSSRGRVWRMRAMPALVWLKPT